MKACQLFAAMIAVAFGTMASAAEPKPVVALFESKPPPVAVAPAASYQNTCSTGHCSRLPIVEYFATAQPVRNVVRGVVAIPAAAVESVACNVHSRHCARVERRQCRRCN